MNWKTIFKSKVIFSISFFTLLCLNINAQQRTCGMEEHMHKKMKDPIYAKQYAELQAKFKSQLAKNIANKNNLSVRRMDPIIIPVAVHFPEGQESDRACLEALAQNQVDILNADYTGTNTDISNWTAAASYYPGVNTGSANISFCLASLNHPTGTDDDLVEGGPAVTIGYNFGNGSDSDTNWGGYMNFLVKDAGDGILGYSPLGGSIADGDSVVISLTAFGSGIGCPNSGVVPNTPYNMGRTVTHELGHFYNLQHTFGSCSDDDGITDTPNQNTPNYGCPALGTTPACDNNEQALFQSYMDYTDDACMFMFSTGQIDVAEAFIMTLESQFKPGVITCSPIPDYVFSSSNANQTICSPTNEVSYSINYTAIGGNTAPTIFTVTNLPSGATATLNPNTLTDSGPTILTVSNLNSIAAGNYNITVTGAGITTKTIDLTLSIEDGLPSIATLVSPANNETNTGVSIDLDWSPIPNATSYIIDLATDAAFTTDLVSFTQNNIGYATPLLEGDTQYFWRVKSINSCGESNYSSIYNFTTATISCFTYNSVENNITIPDTSADPSSPIILESALNITDNVDISDINVTINAQHSYVGDLAFGLESPDGTFITMVIQACGDGQDISATFDDQASESVVCSATTPTINGTFQSDELLSGFNGMSSLGEWKLIIGDLDPTIDGGIFENFTIEICGVASLLSVDEFSVESALSLWPNPSSNGEINMSFNTQNNKDVNVSLYDLRGRLINKQSFNNTSGSYKEKLQFGRLEKAIYILKVENNGQIINKRIIIE